MDDLIAFYRARLDDLERAATQTSDDEYAWNVGISTSYGSIDHAELHTPSRTLREVEAKRRILYEHRQAMPGWCETCDIPGDYKGRPEGCTTVRLLALPYADHHDYREEWKP